ncbi:MAG: DUF1588 domain-containing protein [Planctomycetes bacterium]|nr:DUF1588 domain-containing protein [Planctomycetota bacterium]
MTGIFLNSFAMVAGTALVLPLSAAADEARQKKAAAFVQAHCVKCHGPAKQAGDVRLDNLSTDFAKDRERWLAVRDQIRDGLMPPAKEPRPSADEAKAIVLGVTSSAGIEPGRLPNQGNLIPHELLFGKSAAPAELPYARVWRLNPEGYMGFVRDVFRGRADGIVQPFTVIPERGIKDFAGLYSIDEPTTDILIRNAETIVAAQTAHTIKDGKMSGKNDTVGEFVKLMDPFVPPTRQQLEAAIQLQFRLAIGRPANANQVTRLLNLYEKCAKVDDTPNAVKTMLQAVLLCTDAMYRSELGLGNADRNGGRRLDPLELARAVSLALGDRREASIMQAAQKGELNTKEQVAEHVRRMLNDPKIEKPRLLKFFREYFEYHKATDVFKDRPADKIRHIPSVLVGDTDRLVQSILADDKDVFRQLLTTPMAFVNTTTKTNKQTRMQELVPVDIVPKQDPKRPPEWLGGVDAVYGFKAWPNRQPVELPKETRLGILMQPSWLVAFSTNFDNDPVRRGRWVRERLLGGTVPDLPIGVVAQVPDDPHRTFRDRLTVTRATSCWKCHQHMDELGLPFENFDHYGRFRTSETVRDAAATEKNVDKKGKSLGPVNREAELVISGRIDDSGDATLDGIVKDPREMVRKLADSDRVRQVFIRHVFRYFLGRNESLSDARTLQAADKAYLESGGSFNALLVSLLTSDSFLLRADAANSQTQPFTGKETK